MLSLKSQSIFTLPIFPHIRKNKEWGHASVARKPLLFKRILTEFIYDENPFLPEPENLIPMLASKHYIDCLVRGPVI